MFEANPTIRRLSNESIAGDTLTFNGVIHRTGWTLTPDRDGWFTISTPSGQTLHSQRHGRQQPRTPRQPPDPPG